MRTLPSLNALRTFESAGIYLNFTTASKDLNVTQGAVSRQIKQLEDYLGVKLFVRKKGRLELTEVGLSLHLIISRSFSLIETEVISLVNPNLHQTLNVLVPPTMASRWLAPRLSSYVSKYPNSEVNLFTSREDGVNFDVEINFEEIKRASNHDNLLFLERYIAVCNSENLTNAMFLPSHSKRMIHIRHNGYQLPSWEDWLNAADMILPTDASKGITMSTQEQAINAAVAGVGFAIVDKNMVESSLKRGSLFQFNPLMVQSRYGYTLHISANKRGISKIEKFREWVLGIALD
ncbi:LysR family transcriptional regulator [uncultured Psychromonas sp.]|uniref:LysR family transcriptional regulator n=1 Tax=uncultured Psychromonas sp. TaxID=173974 RepID=UPI0026276B55|nr:LysR family transcriptional regulator [uncultured Psychromonas sp.]